MNGKAPAVATASPVRVVNLNAWYGSNHVLKDINLTIAPNRVTAIIGPSGCGKSTLVRCINRLHEVSPGARVAGQVFVDGEDIYAPGVDPVLVRRRVGMVFQKANPFPMMSVFDNVAAGLRLNGMRRSGDMLYRVEDCLKKAALWDEVRNDLHKSGAALSGGQQQRLCIARAIAVQPSVLLFDEPTSALDPVATERIESLLSDLRRQYTIIIVTHNMQQAARIAGFTAFLYLGEMVEFDETEKLFTNPGDPRTEAYVTGRYG